MTALARKLDRGALVAALTRALGSELSFVAVPLPSGSVEAAWPRSHTDGLAIVQPGGDAFLGFGLTRVPGGAADARAWLANVAYDVSAAAAPALALTLPFEADSPEALTCFAPKVAVRVVAGRAFLTALGVRGDRDAVDELATAILASLAAGTADLRVRIARVLDDDREAYVQRARGGVEAVRRGDVRKVVVARKLELELDGEPEAGALLAALGASEPDGTRYVWGRGGSLFVGATPERLFHVDRGVVTTEAVAGTARGAESAALLRSVKDAAEHRAVVDDIAVRLAPCVEAAVHAESPEVRRLRDVAHLVTSFVGRLAPGAHALDLLALHPTPAVLGSPREAARAVLAQLEPFARGPYAAPLGWFDARGDARVAVALRAARIEGRRASLYAGAGLVEGSVPATELDETELKLRSIMRVFGGAGA